MSEFLPWHEPAAPLVPRMTWSTNENAPFALTDIAEPSIEVPPQLCCVTCYETLSMTDDIEPAVLNRFLDAHAYCP